MKTFEIFDVNRPILEVNKFICSDSPINAVKKYISNMGINLKPVRSGSNYVQISAREVITRNGEKYYKGNIQWYELKS